MSKNAVITAAGPDIDRLVHEHVMRIKVDAARCASCGWFLAERPEDGCVPGNCSMRPKPCGYGSPPPYTSDLRADAIVFAKVAEGWTLAQRLSFINHLKEILDSRRRGPLFNSDRDLSLIFFYRPGDYSRAALAALGLLT